MTDDRRGQFFMIGTALVFALQDGFSQHLASTYNVLMVVMIRYWFFAAFVIALSLRTSGTLMAVARTDQPWIQAGRGILLATEICVMVGAFTLLGLVASHAIFVAYPLAVAALSGPILGERVGWRRWLAIGIGFVGVLIIIRPGAAVFSIYALIPVLSALLFALYGLLTRYAARKDSAATSFFWTGTVGAVYMTLVGLWFWEPMAPSDWIWMGLLCLTGALGHWMLIKAYDYAEAASLQPFAFLQMPFASAIGIFVFGEILEWPVLIGALIVIGAGLFTLHRARLQG